MANRRVKDDGYYRPNFECDDCRYPDFGCDDCCHPNLACDDCCHSDFDCSAFSLELFRQLVDSTVLILGEHVADVCG